MVSDIVLRNLSPPTVKGTSAPLISTKADQRDGTRAGGGGGGSSGLFDINGITPLGLFRINTNSPGSSGVASFSYARGALAHNPPNGSNGTFGSIFIDGRIPTTGHKLAIGEYQIPETLTDPSVIDPELIVSASQIQDYFDIQNTLGNIVHNDSITAMGLDSSGRLFVHTTNGYWQGILGDMTNPEAIGVINTPNDLASSTGIPWTNLELKHSVGNDQGSTYFGEIPPELQALFGNNTHFWGNGNGLSNSARLSQGPSLLAFKPNDYLAQSEIGYDEFINYVSGIYSLGQITGVVRPDDYKALPDVGYSETWDIYNQKAAIHYLSYFGPTGPAIAINPLLDPPQNDLTWETLKVWHDTVIRTPWNSLPPPPGPLNDVWYRALSGVSLAFFVPGTNTFLAIGTMKGRRYGGGYKMPQWQTTWTAQAGPVPLDNADYDIYYWAFDINDILAAANPWDVRPYDYGVLPNTMHAWTYHKNNDRVSSRGGAFFDRGANRLYIPREKVKSSSHEAQTVVEVYQVAA